MHYRYWKWNSILLILHFLSIVYRRRKRTLHILPINEVLAAVRFKSKQRDISISVRLSFQQFAIKPQTVKDILNYTSHHEFLYRRYSLIPHYNGNPLIRNQFPYIFSSFHYKSASVVRKLFTRKYFTPQTWFLIREYLLHSLIRTSVQQKQSVWWMIIHLH